MLIFILLKHRTSTLQEHVAHQLIQRHTSTTGNVHYQLVILSSEYFSLISESGNTVMSNRPQWTPKLLVVGSNNSTNYMVLTDMVPLTRWCSVFPLYGECTISVQWVFKNAQKRPHTRLLQQWYPILRAFTSKYKSLSFPPNSSTSNIKIAYIHILILIPLRTTLLSYRGLWVHANTIH